MPVLFGFHACGSTNRGDGSSASSTQYIQLTNGTDFETDYVRAVPLSAAASGCWTYATDIERAKTVFDQLTEDYCVDLSRVYATGHSSGAQFLVQMLLSNHTSDADHFGFAGVAPVAASDYGAMTGPIPVMYIQGITDQERGGGDGHETVEQFVSTNSCEGTSSDYAPVMGCQSGNVAVDPGCIVYDGCDVPTIWCSHNDPQYNGTFHGVPCFAMDAMADFFATL
jgi:poly(3-hydroxybutyrate) depolymerase